MSVQTKVGDTTGTVLVRFQPMIPFLIHEEDGRYGLAPTGWGEPIAF